MSKTVLSVRSDVKLAGPGRLMLASAQALRRVGIETVFATGGGDMVGEIERAGFRHVHIPELRLEKRSLLSTAMAAVKLTGVARRHRVSIIHSHNAHSGLAAIPASRLTGAFLVNTVHGNGKEGFLRFMPFPLIAVSRSVKEKLTGHGVPAHRISVVYNSTLDDRFILREEGAFAELSAQRAAARPFTFVSVAVFTGRKGHREIVDAVRAYVETARGPDIRVRFVGDGPTMAETRALVDQYGLGDMFEFVGASDHVETHLAQAHAFIHLPEAETFGMVLAEANGLGLPCIAADVGGIPEVISDGETGFLVDRNDPEGVARRMVELVNSEELRLRMGRAGSRRAREMFRIETLAEDLMRLYRVRPDGAPLH